VVARSTDRGRPSSVSLRVQGSSAELVATWDTERALAAARAVGAPIEISSNAGTYCCNAALYRALRVGSSEIQIGFLHVPTSPWPFGPRLGRIARAIDVIVATML
jgi:pyrrolidone-carboxylate peptidase